MFTGIVCALFAGLMWGLVFIVPLLLADYSGVVLSMGRYVAFGLIALVPAFFDRKRMARLNRTDWQVAFQLSLVGNLLYYAMLASAIQLADVPLPTMLIGTLPIVISVCANRHPDHASESVAWRRLAPSLVILLLGLMLVNSSELEHLKNSIDRGSNTRSTTDYALGCIVTLCAIAGWTWYPIVNSRYLRAHPRINPITWATAQGLATLPMALTGFLLYGMYAHASGSSYDFPLGARPGIFVFMMLLTGLLASWIGTLLWNKASQLLPTALLAQLIVFETLAALAYAFLLRGTAPDMKILAGVALLCLGVVFGVRAFSRQTPVSHTP